MEELQQAITVIAVLMMLGGTLYMLRAKGLVRFAVKRARSGNSRRLELIERMPLTAQHSLHLVRVTGRVILIAVSPGGCSVLEGAALGPATDEAVEG